MIWTSQMRFPIWKKLMEVLIFWSSSTPIGNGEFIDKIQYEPHEPGDVMMLTGVGEVFPFMRIHTLLEALQPIFRMFRFW